MDETNPAGITATPEVTHTAPVADRRPVILEAHGQRRTDDYFWLRDDSPDQAETRAYLEGRLARADRFMTWRWGRKPSDEPPDDQQGGRSRPARPEARFSRNTSPGPPPAQLGGRAGIGAEVPGS